MFAPQNRSTSPKAVYRTPKARELHINVLKFIHEIDPKQSELYYIAITKIIDSIINDKNLDVLKERNHSGFTLLADIVHLPFLVHRDPEFCKNKSLTLLKHFFSVVKDPQVLNYFFMQKSNGYNILQMVVSTGDYDILKLFVDRISAARDSGILSLAEIHTLIREEEYFSGNTVLHTLVRKEKIDNIRLLIEWIKKIYGDASVEVLNFLLHTRNAVGFKPHCRKNKEISDYLSALRGKDPLEQEAELKQQKLDGELKKRRLQLDERQLDIEIQEREINNRLRIIEDRERELKLVIKSMENEIQFLHGENNYLTEELQFIKVELDKVQSRKSDYAFELQQTRIQLDESEAERTKLLRENARLHSQNNTLSENLRRVTDSYRIADDRNSYLEYQLKLANEQAAFFESQLRRLRDQVPHVPYHAERDTGFHTNDLGNHSPKPPYKRRPY